MASNSCESCRQDKLECDGQSPCSRCSGTQRQCTYARREASPHASSGSQHIDPAQQAQQHIAEKLRLLEGLFAKLHPDIRIDDLDALREYGGSSSPAQPQAARSEETSHQHRRTATPRPEVDDGPVDSGEDEHLGRTSMPTATINVINQGKTRTSKLREQSIPRTTDSLHAHFKLCLDFEGRFSSWTFFKSARQIVTTGQAPCGDCNGDDENMESGDSSVSQSCPSNTKELVLLDALVKASLVIDRSRNIKVSLCSTSYPQYNVPPT